MSVKLTTKDLKDKSVMVCTPMYGGNANGLYVKSLLELTQMANKNDIRISFNFLFNESLITRARNYLVDTFLRSDFTHLLFIDADIEFEAKDALALIGADKDIIAAPYPKKQIAWEKVYKAAKSFDLKDPKQLSEFAGDFVFNMVDNGLKNVDITEYLEVKETGTGLMAIKRETFEKFRDAYPDLKYKPDHARTEHFDGSREIHAFFETVIDPETKRYLSEDYMFCQYARNAGMKVWICPWMKTKHIGTHVFDSNVLTLSQLPNANLTSIQK